MGGSSCVVVTAVVVVVVVILSDGNEGSAWSISNLLPETTSHCKAKLTPLAQPQRTIDRARHLPKRRMENKVEQEKKEEKTENEEKTKEWQAEERGRNG